MTREIVDRESWLNARAQLLEREKAHTRARAELAQARRALPWVKLDKCYTLMGPSGEVPLGEAFGGQSQLAVYHVMFGPGWSSVCPGCREWANALDGTTAAFPRADAQLIAVSRAPIDQINAMKAQLGWRFTWLSSFASDFNVDFYGSSDDRRASSTKTVGVETVEFDRGENHGVNVFARNEAGEIFHTYSAFNRGIEAMNGAFGYFDALPNGRAW